jgi:hypothetical protein
MQTDDPTQDSNKHGYLGTAAERLRPLTAGRKLPHQAREHGAMDIDTSPVPRGGSRIDAISESATTAPVQNPRQLLAPPRAAKKRGIHSQMASGMSFKESTPTSTPQATLRPGRLYTFSGLLERLEGGQVFLVRLVDESKLVAIPTEVASFEQKAECHADVGPLHTVDQVMEDLHIGRTFFYRLVEEKKLIVVKLEAETRVRHCDLEEFKKSLPRIHEKHSPESPKTDAQARARSGAGGPIYDARTGRKRSLLTKPGRRE